MKTRCPSIFRAAYHLFNRAIFAGAVLLITSSAPAQNLFEADWRSGNIYEFTPDGVQSTFASGLNGPSQMAFQSVPEPSVLGLLAVGATILIVRRRR